MRLQTDTNDLFMMNLVYSLTSEPYWQTCWLECNLRCASAVAGKKRINPIRFEAGLCISRVQGIRNPTVFGNKQAGEQVDDFHTHTHTHTSVCMSVWCIFSCYPSNLSWAVYRRSWKSASRLHPLPLWLDDTSPVIQCPLHPQHREVSQHIRIQGFLYHILELERTVLPPRFCPEYRQCFWCVLNLSVKFSVNSHKDLFRTRCTSRPASTKNMDV